MTASPTVTVLGVGAMGAGMARSLQRTGLDVTVWNRTAERSAPLADDGIHVATTPADAVTHADIVITMLYDADSVLDVATEALPHLRHGAIWMQTSTIGLAATATAAELAARAGVPFVDAPVLGTKGPAEAGTLVMLLSGAADALERIRPACEAMGARSVVVGAEPGAAMSLKLAANAWVLGLTAAAAQSIALSRSLGIDPELFLDAITGTASDSPYAHMKGDAILRGDFAPQFALDGGYKDLQLMQAAAGSSGLHLDLLDAYERLYGRASAAGHGADDLAAVYFGIAADAPERD